jgi:hypothetical protein
VIAVTVFALITGCRIEEEAPDFSLSVTPLRVSNAAPGQMVILLASVTEDSSTNPGPVVISATTQGGTVDVLDREVSERQVAEVVFIPDESQVEQDVPVTIAATRRGITRQAVVVVTIWPEAIPPEEKAAEVRDIFVSWLAENHVELDIDSGTEWTGTNLRPYILVVSYYLFLSDKWEMGVRWHVMIEPYNWAEIYLRHRDEDMAPRYQFKIDSVTAEGTTPYQVEPEDEVWR